MSARPALDYEPDRAAREAAWLYGADTGLSSMTIFSVLSLSPGPNPRARTPTDPADFGRCLRLLIAVPEFASRLQEVAGRYPEWQPLIDHWEELEALYYAELQSGMAPKCYARMKELREAEEQLRQGVAE